MNAQPIKVAAVITGSREWADEEAVYAVLRGLESEALVIHGDCPTGADAIAAHWLRGGAELTEVAMPAQWARDGKAAGHRRNGEMVRVVDALRACGWRIVCHAFPLGKSPGTRGMIAALASRGFAVVDHDPARGVP